MNRVIVFDVTETLLDVGALDPLFIGMFGDAAARREWFGQMLQSAFVSTITGPFWDFGTLGKSALTMVAGRRGVELSNEHLTALRDGMRQLPSHPEVREALEHLRASGFRVETLTNSTLEAGEAQLANANLREFQEQTLSADSVRRLKPAPEPYRMAAERFGVAVQELRLLAAHAWDIAGALNAGCAAAFVARPGQVLDPSGAQPDIIEPDLRGIAERILATDR